MVYPYDTNPGATVPQQTIYRLCVEGQLGWIPFAQYYWDHIWNKHRFWTKSDLAEPPSYYFRRQVYATFMEDPVGIRERGCGKRRTLSESRSPSSTGETKRSRDRLTERPPPPDPACVDTPSTICSRSAHVAPER